MDGRARAARVPGEGEVEVEAELEVWLESYCWLQAVEKPPTALCVTLWVSRKTKAPF